MELKRKRIQIRKYNVAEYQKEAMRQLQPPENLTVSEWAEKYRMLDSKTSAMPGPWRNEKTPYLKEIMDEFINYDTEEIIFCKPSQVGGTEAMQNMLGYAYRLSDRYPGGINKQEPTGTNDQSQQASAQAVQRKRIIEAGASVRGNVSQSQWCKQSIRTGI